MALVLVGGASSATAAEPVDEALQAKIDISQSAEYKEAMEDLTLSIDLTSPERVVNTTTLSDGTVLELGAEPAENTGVSARAAKTGTWRIWGSNAFAYMEYFVTYGPVSSGSSYTKVVSTSGLVINAFAGVTFTGGSIDVERRNETASAPSWVRGKAAFKYWDVAQLTGGVEAFVRNGELTTGLW